MLSQLTSLLGIAPTKSVPEARKDAQPDADFASIFAEAEDDTQSYQPDPGSLPDADEVAPADPLNDPDTIAAPIGDPDEGTDLVDDLDLLHGGSDKLREIDPTDRRFDPDPGQKPDEVTDPKGAAFADHQSAEPSKQWDGWLQRLEDSRPKRDHPDVQPVVDRDADQVTGPGSLAPRDWRKTDSWINGIDSKNHPSAAEATFAENSSSVAVPMRGLLGAEAQPVERFEGLQVVDTEVKTADPEGRDHRAGHSVTPVIPHGETHAGAVSPAPLTSGTAAKPLERTDPGLPDIPVFRFGLSQPTQEHTWPRPTEPPVSRLEQVVMPAGQGLPTGSASLGSPALAPKNAVAGAIQPRDKPVSPLRSELAQGSASDQIHRIDTELRAPAGVQVTSGMNRRDPRDALHRFTDDLALAAKPGTESTGKPGLVDQIGNSQGIEAKQVPLATPKDRLGSLDSNPDVFRTSVNPTGVSAAAEGGPVRAGVRGSEPAIGPAQQALSGEGPPMPRRLDSDPSARVELGVTTRVQARPVMGSEPVVKPLEAERAESVKQSLRRGDPNPAPRLDGVIVDNTTVAPNRGSSGWADVAPVASGGATPALADVPMQGTVARVTSPFIDDLAEDLLRFDSQPAAAAPGAQPAPVQALAMPQVMHRMDAASILRQVSDGMARLGEGSVEIRLSPEELGQVRMQLVSSDNGMTVHITADRPETLDLMRRHIDQLARDLAEAGYESASFSFGEGGEGGEEPTAHHDHAETMPRDDTPTNAPPKTEPASDGLDLRF
jgi:hypothetical protein